MFKCFLLKNLEDKLMVSLVTVNAFWNYNPTLTILRGKRWLHHQPLPAPHLFLGPGKWERAFYERWDAKVLLSPAESAFEPKPHSSGYCSVSDTMLRLSCTFSFTSGFGHLLNESRWMMRSKITPGERSFGASRKILCGYSGDWIL